MGSDFEFLGGASGLAKGFIQALKDKQDRNERLKESAEDRALRKLQLDVSARSQHLIPQTDQGGQVTGYLEDPQYQEQQNRKRQLEEFESGGKYGEGGYVFDPESPKGKELGLREKDYGLKQNDFKLKQQQDITDAWGKKLLPKVGPDGFIDVSKGPGFNKDLADSETAQKLAASPYASTLHERQAFQAHQKNIQRLKMDPVLTNRMNQYQNLGNALSMITQAHELTPQQIHEFQQAIRGNIGITGTGGVGEREETYFKTAGLNAANWKQFLTGDPVSIAKDSKLMDHLRNLADVEQSNIRKQYDSRMKAVTGGNASIYRENPDLKADLDELVQGFGEQVQAPGMIQEPPQGMMKMRKVKDRSGSIFQIPEEDLADAIADGAIEVE